MGLLVGYKTNKAISTLLNQQVTSPEGKQAIVIIKKIGSPAIPKLIQALSSNHTQVIESILITMLNNSTLPMYVNALGNENANIIEGITRVMVKSTEYDVTRLLPEFENTKISKNALGEILLAHSNNLNANPLLALVDNVPSNVRPLIYRILDKVVDESSIDSLTNKTQSKEPLVRTQIATLLSRFNSSKSIDSLINLLHDGNKSVRQAALRGLAKLKAEVAVQPICQLLKDPDLMVQSTAIEALTLIRARNTVKYLIEILQDESEYVRRAAVEVLNEVGDQSAIKDLLNALRDADWWVKVRAADALGSIGGPKVIDAVMLLIKDEDEFLRRTAVEILNTSQDERAFYKLVEALEDEDWWVRERAADALAALGDKRAVEPLINMLRKNPEASQIIIKALAELGDKRAIKPLLEHLSGKNDSSIQETLHALEELADETTAADVHDTVSKFINNPNESVSTIARQTLVTLQDKVQGKSKVSSAKLLETDKSTDSPDESTLMLDFGKLNRRQIVDATKLKPNDMFANRYRVIKHVGKGAFGVVVLVEDIMVKDEFILKFLNPHFASDADMVKRFTQELRYSRKVTHENIIRIYDLINHDESYAISMEYFPSHSLADELKNKTKFSFERAFTLLDEICSGMSAAEQVNVVHRDLKPSNILINDNDIVKIVDFGLAAAASSADSRLTKTGILVGTPTYMAPEQVRGKTIDSKTDIYSLGIIMYEMFTGQAPYKGEGSLAIMYQHVEGNAKPPRELNPDIPYALECTINQAMAVDPAQRFTNFKELRQQLRVISKEMQLCPA
jgi:serine/threonine-protein kinase